MDDGIVVSPQDIRKLNLKIKRYKPLVLAFNGKNPARKFLERDVEYGLQKEYQIGQTKIYVLPSTSPRNLNWDVSHWRKLHKLIDAQIAQKA
jgi:G:T/U-mismatch repair DNA glycosylase